MGELLCSGPGKMRASAMVNGSDFYKAAEGLLDTVRTGNPTWQSVFHQTMQEYYESNPDAERWFDIMMESRVERYNSLLQLFNFSSYKVVVDVGGGNGALLSVILKGNPQSKGVLFELPKMAGLGRDFLISYGLSDRCDVEEGDALVSVPAGGDLYILSAVLHDYQDQDASMILTNVRKAIGKSKSELLILEGVLPDDIQLSPLIHRDFLLMCIGERKEPKRIGGIALCIRFRLCEVSEDRPTHIHRIRHHQSIEK